MKLPTISSLALAALASIAIATSASAATTVTIENEVAVFTVSLSTEAWKESKSVTINEPRENVYAYVQRDGDNSGDYLIASSYLSHSSSYLYGQAYIYGWGSWGNAEGYAETTFYREFSIDGEGCFITMNGAIGPRSGSAGTIVTDLDTGAIVVDASNSIVELFLESGKRYSAHSWARTSQWQDWETGFSTYFSNNNGITFEYIPEPSSILLMALSSVMLFRRKR